MDSSVEKVTLSSDRTLEYLCEEYERNNFIDPEISEKLGVKRGLRNADGTGVLAGLTNVCDVVGYDMVNGEKVPLPGKLVYRGIDVEDIVEAAAKENRFMFEEVIWLLLFGTLPGESELESFKQMLEDNRVLPDSFVDDMILKAPSPDIMNKMERGVLALYSYDDAAEDQSLGNVI
ncbi:citrate synthase, partial [Ruminococcaceae bacterium OttesenSCG-928-O06]|nr:citrate synthase [Ruminococcaceae bacterium OttesenSCG-928-O06]